MQCRGCGSNIHRKRLFFNWLPCAPLCFSLVLSRTEPVPYWKSGVREQLVKKKSLKKPENQISFPENQISFIENQISFPENQILFLENRISFLENQISFPENQILYDKMSVHFPEN